MERKLTPTLALILAGGLAAGIALARPGDTASTAAVAGGAQPGVAAPADGTDPAADDENYRVGTRQGNRGGVPAAGGGPAESGQGATAPAGQDQAAAPAPGAAAAFDIEGFAFSGPATVAPGASLTVTNLDSAPHTLTFRGGQGDTATLGQGESATISAPTTPGTYEFFCAIHPSMEGQVAVVG